MKVKLLVFTQIISLLYLHFSKNRVRQHPGRFRHLDYIGQFTTDIQYVTGKNNIPADFLSRIEEISFPNVIDYYDRLQLHQEADSELKHLLMTETTGLKLKKLQGVAGNTSIYYDTSTTEIRPYITPDFRRIVFNTIHNVAHPGQRQTVKQIASRFVWPSMRKDCAKWAKTCLQCQIYAKTT